MSLFNCQRDVLKKKEEKNMSGEVLAKGLLRASVLHHVSLQETADFEFLCGFFL